MIKACSTPSGHTSRVATWPTHCSVLVITQLALDESIHERLGLDEIRRQTETRPDRASQVRRQRRAIAPIQVPRRDRKERRGTVDEQVPPHAVMQPP